MNKYKIRLSKEDGSKFYEAIVEANAEEDAFLEVVKMAEQDGIVLPEDVWTRTEIIN